MMQIVNRNSPEVKSGMRHVLPAAEASVVIIKSFEGTQGFAMVTALCTILMGLSFATTMKLLVEVIVPSPN